MLNYVGRLIPSGNGDLSSTSKFQDPTAILPSMRTRVVTVT
jgi:hypothetical protein